MSDLPTLYVYTPDLTRNDGAPDDAPIVYAETRGNTTPYVPAARLEEAERLLAQWTTAADYDRERTTPASEEAHDLWARIDDKPHFALPTIQAVLDQRDAANLEIARLKAQVSNAVANLEEAQILFASIRQADALAPWACESEPGEDSFDEQVREMLRDLEKITGFAARQRAALTPKEP